MPRINRKNTAFVSSISFGDDGTATSPPSRGIATHARAHRRPRRAPFHACERPWRHWYATLSLSRAPISRQFSHGLQAAPRRSRIRRKRKTMKSRSRCAINFVAFCADTACVKRRAPRPRASATSRTLPSPSTAHPPPLPYAACFKWRIFLWSFMCSNL